MNIAMTGATGYIGKHLSSYLTEKGGHRIIPLGRAMFREGMSGLLVQTLTHCDVIINLAGAPINQRWTPEHKQELFNSRITVTHRIIRALNAVKTKPKLMIWWNRTNILRLVAMVSCLTFAMRGRRKRNVVRNRQDLLLHVSGSCFLPMEERCSRCSDRCVQRKLPPP